LRVQILGSGYNALYKLKC